MIYERFEIKVDGERVLSNKEEFRVGRGWGVRCWEVDWFFFGYRRFKVGGFGYFGRGGNRV